MVHKIKLHNVSRGTSVAVSDDGESEFVLDRVDWDAPNGEMSTYTIPFQIGQTLQGVHVGTRSPVIYGYIIHPLEREQYLGKTIEQYYALQEKGIEENKKKLNGIVNMMQDVKISVGSYYLIGRPTKPVVYGVEQKENNEVLCSFKIELKCVNPMFVFDEGKTVLLAGTKSMFHFPLVLEKTGNVFGELLKQTVMAVVNDGDCDIGGTIVFTARGGGIHNPKVINVLTGEYMQVDVTLEDGDSLTIDTRIGRESVVLHDSSEGTHRSVIMYVREGSSFIQFKQGSWLYGYEVSSETEVFANVVIGIEEQFYNLEDM